MFVQVVNNSELSLIFLIKDQLQLNLISWIVLLKLNRDWYFVCIVVQVDEAVVQEESRVAFATIAVVNLFASLDVVGCFNDKSSLLVAVVPGGLLWSLMIEHVSKGHKSISLDSVDCDTKDSARNNHSRFFVLSQGEFSKVGGFLADQFIIRFDVLYFFVDLVQEGTSLKPFQFVISKVDREVIQSFWQDV